MRALTWHSAMHVEVDDVAEPTILDPGDAIVRVTSTAICGSDLHLLDVLGPFLRRGDILGHEAMGVVEEVGAEVRTVAPGDRVVVPFVIACGECAFCRAGLQTQCAATRQREQDAGAALYGYTHMYGGVPGGQAERLRVLRADANAIRVGGALPDDRYLFLSDILPTAWQGVDYARIPPGGSVVVLGLGPVGQFAARVAGWRGHDVIAVDPVPERRRMAQRHGIPALDLDEDTLPVLLDRSGGEGPDAVVDAVGMEAHGSPVIGFAQRMAGMLPAGVGEALAKTAGIDRLGALHLAIDLVRRGGTISLSGVYAGVADPMPMLRLFDKQVTLRMGQCNVQRWTNELLPLVEDPADPLGTEDLVTHRVPLDRAPEMYETFRDKRDGCVKVVLEP